MKLYHYTSLEHLEEILDDGEIKLTASNLLRPKAPYIDKQKRAFVDETDSYKPVVWFTSLLDFDKAVDCGLYKEKTEAAILLVPTVMHNIQKWDEWAAKNDIDENWFAILKETAPQWETFYITETPVKIDSNTSIVFRPDIMEDLQKWHNERSAGA